MTTKHPDAELFRHHERIKALTDAVNGRGDTEARQDEHMAEIHRLEEVIAETPAQTFAGIAVKLAIASDSISDDTFNPTDEQNIVSALEDCQRLAVGERTGTNPNDSFRSAYQDLEHQLTELKHFAMALDIVAEDLWTTMRDYDRPGSKLTERRSANATMFLVAQVAVAARDLWDKWEEPFNKADREAPP